MARILALSLMLVAGVCVAAACDSRSSVFGDKGVCVGQEGAISTSDLPPCEVIARAWGACGPTSCNGVEQRVDERGACLIVKISGSYGGWGDRNDMIAAALLTQGGKCGSSHRGSWYGPTRTWIRREGAWINIDTRGC